MGRWVFLFGLGASAVVGASYLLVAPPTLPDVPAERPTGLRKLEWALPVGLLTVLFALFVAVQFATLFGSDEHVLRTTRLTYAEYARSGFWQLLIVTVLALGVIALGARFAPQRTSSERLWKRCLLAALASNTLVIVASAISRMWLYQQAYGFTVLRLVVLVCELWLGFAFLLVLAGVLRLRPAGLARGMLASGVAALLGLAVLNADGFVAKHNIDRLADHHSIDTSYLGTLSADALPALNSLAEPMRSCVLQTIKDDLPTSTDWRSWNLARAAAAGPLAALVPAPAPDPSISSPACRP